MTVDWITEDALTRPRIGTFTTSPMIELKDDHPDSECDALDGKCMQDAAAWPTPRFGSDLTFGWPV